MAYESSESLLFELPILLRRSGIVIGLSFDKIGVTIVLKSGDSRTLLCSSVSEIMSDVLSW